MRTHLPKEYTEWETFYQKSVDMAKTFLGDRAFMLDEESRDRGYMALFIMMIKQEKKTGQLLIRHTTDDTGKFRISRTVDIITAFYIPENIQWVKLMADFNNITCSEWINDEKPDEKELEEVLEESRTVPETFDLERLLEFSRQGNVGFIYNGEDTISIDGVRHYRVVLVHPFIPLHWLSYDNLILEMNTHCTFYIESVMVDSKIISDISRQELLLWSDMTKCLITKEGTLQPLYNGESKINELPNIDILLLKIESDWKVNGGCIIDA